MGGLAEAAEKVELEHILSVTLWVTLCMTAPTKSAAGTAPSGIKRQEIESTGWNAVKENGEDPASATNKTAPLFEVANGESEPEYFELWTAETGGERKVWGKLTKKGKLSASSKLEISAGELEVTLS